MVNIEVCESAEQVGCLVHWDTLNVTQINKEIMNVGIDVHKAIYWELLATDASSPWVSIMKRHPTNGRKVTNDKTGHAFAITLIFYRVEKP